MPAGRPPGGAPKEPALRARRNRASTAATIVAKRVRHRSLPKGRDWAPQVRSWWRDLWRSELVREWLDIDVHRLYLLADLLQDFWAPDTGSEAKRGLAAEIRLQGQCFGLTPIDRRRLDWTIQREEEPKRSARPEPQASIDQADDPRRLLAVMSGGKA